MVEFTQKNPNFPQNGLSTRKSPVISQTKDLQYYYSLMLNKWYWLALGLLVGMFLFYVDMRYAKYLYRISGSVLIEDPNEQSVSKEVIAQQLGFDKETSNMEDRIRILSSTELLQRVVDSLDLNVSYIQEGKVKTHELYGESPIKIIYWNTEEGDKSFQIKIQHHSPEAFKLYRSETDLELIKYGMPFNYGKRELILKRIGIIPDQTPIIINIRDEYQVAEQYRGALDIKQEGRSNILTISMIDEIPARGVAIINRLAREYAVSIMETKNEIGKRTLRFIDERLNYVTRELYDVEQNVQGFKQERTLPLAVPEMAKNYIERTNAVDAKIMELDIRADLVKNIERIINETASNRYRPLPFSTEILNNAPLSGLITRYNELINKRAQIMESAKEGNPILSSSDEELTYLKSNILFSVQTIKQEVAEQKERYRQQIIPLENQINTMPSNDRELTQILREKGIKESLFLFLLQKREETALTVAAQVAHSRLLERAANKGPVAPKPLQMALFYLFLGLGIPMGAIYLRDTFNNKVYHRSDIEKYLGGLPFVGFIPHTRRKRNRNVLNDSRSALAESFRLVRSNLQNTAHGSQHRTILVASSVSGDGKSFVAMNLALTLALTGKKVALIGLDLRKPKVGIYLLGEKPEKGVTNYLKGEGSLKDFLKPYDELPNLHFMDCGTLPSNPSELLMTDKLKNMFTTLHEKFDFVVVDGAPIGVVADTFQLKDFIEQTVIVLRYGSSTISHLKFLREVQAEDKLQNINIILNDVRQEHGNSYNYGFYSSDYYKEDKNIWTRLKETLKPRPKPNRRKEVV